MAKITSAMDVFKLLEKTNCKQCNKPTCLAFAAAVFQSRAALSECPFIDKKTLNIYGEDQGKRESRAEQDYQMALTQLKQEVSVTDLEARAKVLGEKFAGNKLTLKVLGKDFSVDSKGEVSTIIHTNRWLVPPVLHYILQGQGLPVTQKWVPFKELEMSKDWTRFFEHQCVNLFKKVADSNPTFFEDIIDVFNGKPVEKHFDSDISLIIKPLPLLPILICYNHSEEGLDSYLNLFFDITADKNLPVESIYTLTTGLGRMFEKLAETHG
ncbi:DUF3786 domain-containing protein [Desulforhopalus sp. 52FAK]